MIHDSSDKKLDVHNLTLEDAKQVITREVKNCYNNGSSILYVVHGFNNGTKIKTWCLKHGTTLEFVEKVVEGANPGESIFYIRFNPKYLR